MTLTGVATWINARTEYSAFTLGEQRSVGPHSLKALFNTTKYLVIDDIEPATFHQLEGNLPHLELPASGCI